MQARWTPPQIASFFHKLLDRHRLPLFHQAPLRRCHGRPPPRATPGTVTGSASPRDQEFEAAGLSTSSLKLTAVAAVLNSLSFVPMPSSLATNSRGVLVTDYTRSYGMLALGR